jgi:hypothetical protein
MFRKTIFLAALLSLSVVSVQVARAQSDERKFEVGGQFTWASLPIITGTSTTFPCTTPPCPVGTTYSRDRKNDLGFGGRVGYNMNSYLTFEAEGNLFPRDRTFEGGRKLQGLFGAKVGKRFDKVGLFAKARPGFMRFSKGDYQPNGGGCVAVFPPPIGCFNSVAVTRFAFDVGGVAEFYPSKNTIVRFDAGDTIIRYGNRNVAAFDPLGGLAGSGVVIPVGSETKHNFQGSLGFGYRF